MYRIEITDTAQRFKRGGTLLPALSNYPEARALYDFLVANLKAGFTVTLSGPGPDDDDAQPAAHGLIAEAVTEAPQLPDLLQASEDTKRFLLDLAWIAGQALREDLSLEQRAIVASWLDDARELELLRKAVGIVLSTDWGREQVGGGG